MNKLPAGVAKIMAEEVKKATAAKSAAEAQKAELQKAAAIKAASPKVPTGMISGPGNVNKVGAEMAKDLMTKVGALGKSTPPNMPMPSRTVRDPRAVASGGSAGTPDIKQPPRPVGAVPGGTGPKTLPPNMAAPQAVTPPGAFGSRNGPSSGFGGIPLQQSSSAPGPTTPPGAFGVRSVPGRNTSGGFKKGGKIKSKSSYSSGGKVSSASKRADGIATKGKTKGRIV